MSDRNGSGFGTFLTAFLTGAIAGGAIALLYAPEPGAATRRRLRALAADGKQKAGRVQGAIREAVEQFSESARHTMDESRYASAEDDDSRSDVIATPPPSIP